MSYNSIPQRTLDSIHRYVEHGIEPGSFVTAVLENNLVEAVGRADLENSAALADIVRYVYNEIPGQAWGNPNKVRAWLKKARDQHV